MNVAEELTVGETHMNRVDSEMKATERRLNRRDGKKFAISLGGVGGIGGVVLFVGGALAAVAFASAFVLRRRRRGFSEDGRDRRPTEVEKRPDGEEEAREEGHEIHVSLEDTSLLPGEQQSDEETERNDSQMLVVCPGTSIQAAIPGTENSGAVPSEKKDTLVSTTLSKPENEAILSDFLFIEEGSRSYEKSSPTSENPEKIHSVVDEDFASEVRKDKDDALGVNGSQSTYEESIDMLNYGKEENPGDNSVIGPGLDVEISEELPKNEGNEEVEVEEFTEDNTEIDAKKHDEFHGSLLETENDVEDKNEIIADDVIMEKSVVCESEPKKEAGDLDQMSKQEDIEDDDTESLSFEVESSNGSGDSSLESNSAVVCPTEYLKESPLWGNAGEVEGKMMQEDKAHIMAGNSCKSKEYSSTKRRMLLFSVLLMLTWALALWLIHGQATLMLSGLPGFG